MKIEGSIEDNQRGFKSGRGCEDQVFTLRQLDEKAREKKQSVYIGFMDLKNMYDRIIREALWQVLNIYDVGALYNIMST